MDIFATIDRIREKPEYIRRRYVWACVSIFMAVVLGVWFLTLRSNFGSSKGIIKDEDRLQMMESADQKNKIQENLPGDYEDYYYQELEKSLQNSETPAAAKEEKNPDTNSQPTANQESGSGVGQYDVLTPKQ